MKAPGVSTSILDRIQDVVVLEEHDGRSGASVATGVLDDGTNVFVKRATLENDISFLLTGSATRERDLFASGVLDRLPSGVRGALLGVEVVDGELVTVSRDVGHAILTWDRVLTAGEVDRAFGAIASLHRAFAADPPEGLCALADRISILGPARVAAIAEANPGLAASILRGWELFDDLVPEDVGAAVHRAFARPEALAAALAQDGCTLLHGDFWLVNLALDGDDLVLLDWGLATLGPPALDYITFCTGGASNVAMSREDLLAAARRACGASSDDVVFHLAELWALMELGWNKALDAVDNEDEAKRITERADLDFWVGRARQTLDLGLFPL